MSSYEIGLVKEFISSSINNFDSIFPSYGKKLFNYMFYRSHLDKCDEMECVFKNKEFVNYLKAKNNIFLSLLDEDSPYYSQSFYRIIKEVMEDDNVDTVQKMNSKIPSLFTEQNDKFWNFLATSESKEDSKRRIKANCNEMCYECRTRNVTYRAEQLRSADEGMTIIYTCNDCGSVWKG